MLRPRPQLRHLGIHVRDLAVMEAFYTKLLGLVATDRGQGFTFKNDFIFLTGSPDQHHQLVLVSGRAPEGASMVNQLSFKVGELDELREMHKRIRAAGVEGIRPVNHGNAFSIYFPDPEGNFVEVYMDTPWHIAQPHGDPLDFSLTNDALMADTEARCRKDPTFLPRAEREAELARRIERQLSAGN
jgi:catechol 2,3-dioxygenase